MEQQQQGEQQRAGKRKRLTAEERRTRCRERNRMHARRTREKKKHEYTVLQTRVNVLRDEGVKLRQTVDEHYTAASLLDLGRPTKDGKPKPAFKQSSAICGDSYQEVMVQRMVITDSNLHPLPGSRRCGKYTAQERASMRRARNCMHAKRTRDRKKAFFDVCEQAIELMQQENAALREYLVDIEAITVQQAQESIEREAVGKQAAALCLSGSCSIGAKSNDDSHDSTDHVRRSKRTRSTGTQDSGDGDHDSDGEEEGNSDENEESEHEKPDALLKLAPRNSPIQTPPMRVPASPCPRPVLPPNLVSKPPSIAIPAAYFRPPMLEYAYPPYNVMPLGIGNHFHHRIPTSGAVAYMPHMVYSPATAAEYSPYPLIHY